MLRPLGNAIIARKIDIKEQGGLFLPDAQGLAEKPAQLCEIVAMPDIDPVLMLKPIEAAIYLALHTGDRVYVRFRGYILEEDADGNELVAIAIEDVLAIVEQEAVQ